MPQQFFNFLFRCMAQFVGGESKYNGILSGFGEIYKENGLLGTDSNALQWGQFNKKIIFKVV